MILSYELGVLPSGHIHCTGPDATKGKAKSVVEIIASTFSKKSSSEGLLLLSSLQSVSDLPTSFRFWKSFADQYMTQLCQLTHADQIIGIEAPDEDGYRYFLNSLPPMRGAEYVSSEMLEETWQELDDYVRDEVIENFNEDLGLFLKKRAAHWHQTGRVCFHLAENKSDPEYPFAFMATYLPEGSAKTGGRHQLLGKALEEYAGAKNKSRLIHLLSPVDRASSVSPLIKELVDCGDIYHPLAWTPNEAYQFLKEATLFENCGIHVRLPDWWKKRARPRVQVTLDTGSSKTFNVTSLLSFDVSLAVGDQLLTEKEWQALLAADDNLVLLNNQWVEVDKEKLEEALSHWRTVEGQVSEEGITFVDGMRLLAGTPSALSAEGEGEEHHQWSTVQSSDKLTKILRQIRQPETLKESKPGKSLKATLRPYQGVGVNWLWYLHQLGLGACLADDMGLGKTIQIISVLLKLKKSKTKQPSLIVLPASLIGNWQQELDKFAPSLKHQTIHPSAHSKKELESLKSPNALLDYDVVFTSYSMLLRQEFLFDYKWQLVVLDEAQAIKNPGARQTKAAKKLVAQSKVALTGTPVENRLSDLWSLFDFICPGLLGNASSFKKYEKSLESESREGFAPLRKLVRPYILRRLKTDKSIISDLPDKTEVRAFCSLSKEQAVLYAKTVRDLTKKLEGAEGIDRRGLVLSYLMRFKQICNHPSQLLGDGAYDFSKSGKFSRLAEICEEISSRQEKVLVFTQFRSMCEPLHDFLTECFNHSGLVLHGGIAVKKRQKLVQQFQQEGGAPFFVLSLKAGGTGLNLTAASHVIHFDRWWNPAVENQATDRAFRIGQHKNVLVHKFVCSGTVEEKIDTLIEEKMALASDLLDADGAGGEKLLTEMNDEELIELVTLDLEKTKAS